MQLHESTSQPIASIFSGDSLEQGSDNEKGSKATLYQALEASLPLGIWMADRMGQTTYVSPSFLNLIGMPFGEYKVLKGQELVHPADRDGLRKKWFDAITTVTPMAHEFRIQTADGSYSWIHTRGTPLLSAEGDLTGWAGVHIDLTEQRRTESCLRENEQRYRAIIDMASEGIWKTDARGFTEFANCHLAELLGLTPEDFARYSIWDLIDASCIEDLERCWSGLKAGNKQQTDAALRRVNGSLVWVKISSTPIFDHLGQFAGAILLLTDVTERKSAEETLISAKRIADEANKAKSQFLANMSHEIRTPLGAVLGFAELLSDDEQDSEKRRDCVSAIKRNGELLLNLINDILDLSKVEAGRLDVEPVNFELGEFIFELQTFFRVQAQKKGLALTIEADDDLPSSVVTDPTRLRQVLLNIIGNALKFTAQGEVSVRFQRRCSQIVVTVEDTGPGIRSEDASRLFTPFTQADTSITRRYGGTGLGLVLSRNLARALGGDVRLASSFIGKGSIFEVSFTAELQGPISTGHLPGRTAPAPWASSLHLNTEPPPGVALDHVEILLVDDSADNRLLLRRILEPTGAHVTIATNGHDGVDLALAGRFDVILMDIQMPVMDGYEATHQLRRQGYKGPIIALTAHAMKDEKERCLAVGCDRHLVKPIDRRQLIENIQDLIRKELAFWV